MRVARGILDHLPLGYFPVRVRCGIARGAAWTIYPYSAYWRGPSERGVDEAIERLGSLAGASCWDLGAHFGIYTVGLAMRVGAEGKVAAFEPDPQSFRRCRRHVRMNRLFHVDLFLAAASDRTGAATLLRPEGPGASTSHFQYEDESAVAASSVRVEALRLDDLVEAGRVRLPDLIKVDVEGHGHHALRGAKGSLDQSHPAIVMSFHSRWELEGTREILHPLGYRACQSDGEGVGWSSALYRTVLLTVAA